LKARVLDKAYKNEHDARVKERILLIIRVSPDKQHIESVASELHRSRAWAYKWYKRYKDEGIKGLRDRPRVESLQWHLAKPQIRSYRNCQIATQVGISDR
jgi:methylphosphotriester-DNA--protein-cysteine methyltransferase